MTRLRLFCFPHAGGGGMFFRPWRDRLGPDVEIEPVVLPGREALWRELPLTHMDQVVERAMRQVEPGLTGPFAFFGHSMGAAVAFELTRRFFSRPGSGLAHLFVSGRRAPLLPARQPPAHALPRDEFLRRVALLNGIPAEVMAEPDLVDRYLPCLRADFQVNESYAPTAGPRLPVRISAFLGESDPLVTVADMLRWRDVTNKQFSFRVFSGDHFYLKGGRPELLNAISADLRAAAGLVDH